MRKMQGKVSYLISWNLAYMDDFESEVKLNEIIHYITIELKTVPSAGWHS